ncbi:MULTISPECIES: FtsB family cell division protein [Actinokineospora]|uniref:Septation ring formation regulator EzrA n=1 Tax=Actinokineospora fastidiosa TaxID=1816 RepID=A0A918G312_9PSEU|nr:MULTISPECIES: septum formation initiator family protein [Actinokineospora]UVS76981.1 Septum formation initiator [Actinokineospora sp. UTMC 2448]GGS14364.1 septation ring formation regulator EzrA [Actinokineospora fastidiosa]
MAGPDRTRGRRTAARGPVRGLSRRIAALSLPFGVTTTRRAAILATVVCALALSVAVPLRTYLSQRSEVEIQEQRQAELRAQVDQLERRRAELADPEQIKAEARARLRFVMPGETPYMVELPSEGQPDQERTPLPDQAWYQELWESMAG